MAGPRKEPEKDPQKEAEDSGKNLNKEPKLEGFPAEIKNGTDPTQPDFEVTNQHQWLAQNGFDATAEVLAITHTGTFINSDPVVLLTLKVQPAMIARDFKITGKTMVSRSAVPRVGDRLKLKYNPANPAQFIVVST